jgi:hypothetical protein
MNTTVFEVASDWDKYQAAMVATKRTKVLRQVGQRLIENAWKNQFQPAFCLSLLNDSLAYFSVHYLPKRLERLVGQFDVLMTSGSVSEFREHYLQREFNWCSL